MSEFTNADDIAREIAAVGPAALLRLPGAVRETALLLETMIKANASGRPGPNVITGDYRGSWTTDLTAASGSGGTFGVGAEVGTTKPQARRLEYGFVGPDVLGRVYNQPPFPHVQPAVDRIGPILAANVAKAMDL